MIRNLFIIAAFFISIIGIILLGNIIVIGDKIGTITHPYVEIFFYGIVLLLFAMFIIRPIIRVHYAPELPKLNIDGQYSKIDLYKFGKKLANNCNYIADQSSRNAHRKLLMQEITVNVMNEEELRNIINKELTRRFEGDENSKGIHQRIKDWALSVFMVTAISQNSKIDTLSVLYLNYKMIEDIVYSSGFRPNNRQLFNLYRRVLSTALISYVSSEMINDIDVSNHIEEDANNIIGEESNIESFIDKLSSIPGASLLMGSVIDGTLNSLLTLRIGYVTKRYLIEGSESFSTNKKTIRKQAIEDAIKTIPDIVYKGVKNIGGKVCSLIIKHMGWAEQTN